MIYNHKMWKKLILYSWACATLGRIITAYHNTYTPSYKEYISASSFHKRCPDPLFRTEFPVECDYWATKTPPLFVVLHATRAFEQVSWCGVSTCEDLLSIKGIIVSGIVALIMRSPGLVKKAHLRLTTI